MATTDTIPSANSASAPGLVFTNESIVAVWSDASSNAIFLSVFFPPSSGPTPPAWSEPVQITGSSSQCRPAITGWNNGSIYTVHKGVSGDTSVYYWMTDLTTLPLGVISITSKLSAAFTASLTPSVYPYVDDIGNSLLAIAAPAAPASASVNYVVFQANWLAAGAANVLLPQPQSFITLPLPSGVNVLYASLAVSELGLCCLVYVDSNQDMFSYSCFNMGWAQAGVSTQIASSVNSSPGVVVMEDNVFCVAWASGGQGYYSMGNLGASPPIINWTDPATNNNWPTGINDISLSLELNDQTEDGVPWIGYALQNGSIGLAALNPSPTTVTPRPRKID